MRRRKGWGLWIVIIAVLAGQVFIAITLSNVPDQGLNLIGWITGAIIPAIGILYALINSNSVRFFIYTNRLRSILLDISPTWMLSAQWADEKITPQLLDKVVEELKQKTNK